jgi:CubicO group peptidase (beta-lactamase class C family)
MPFALECPRDLDGFFSELASSFGIPGCSVAIVGNGAVWFAGGFGLRQEGRAQRVDADTVFAIGSNTKAFTAAALLVLQQEKKIALDDPVEDHLPDFRLSDPFISRGTTIRDLLCHRTGLGEHAGDLLFVPPSRLESRELVRRLRHLPLAHRPRAKFAYSNLGYVAAGEVVAQRSGMSWQAFISLRLLKALGMGSASAGHEGLLQARNLALPHARPDNLVEPAVRPLVVTPVNFDNAGAASAINASANDMAQWLLELTGRGADAKRAVLNAQSVREMWTPQIVTAIAEPPPPLAATRPSHAAAGLGFRLYCYRGTDIALHGGNVLGYTSVVTLVPALRTGFAILTNADDGGDAVQAAHYHLLDHVLGLRKTDWRLAYLDARKLRSAEARAALAQASRVRSAASGPSLPLARYAGTYVDPWLGEARLAFADNALSMAFSGREAMTATLEHWQFDTFRARWREAGIAEARVKFSLGFDGLPDEIRMEPASPLADQSFDYGDVRLVRVRE